MSDAGLGAERSTCHSRPSASSSADLQAVQASVTHDLNRCEQWLLQNHPTNQEAWEENSQCGLVGKALLPRPFRAREAFVHRMDPHQPSHHHKPPSAPLPPPPAAGAQQPSRAPSAPSSAVPSATPPASGMKHSVPGLADVKFGYKIHHSK